MSSLMPFFQALVAELGPGYKLHQTFDRILIRHPSKRLGSETFHRDEAVTGIAGDHILGGWVNLNDIPEAFSCVRGTHTGSSGTGGFSKISKEDAKKFKTRAEDVMVPPGSCILFYEQIVHEVKSTRVSFVRVRQFMGWRLTKSDKPLQDRASLECVMTDQGVPLLKSGHALGQPPRVAARVDRQALCRQLHHTTHRPIGSEHGNQCPRRLSLPRVPQEHGPRSPPPLL